MITTPDLIDHLVDHGEPVRRLQAPNVRAGWWLVIAMLVLTMLLLGQTIRSDIRLRLEEGSFVVNLAAIFLTAAASAITTFRLVVPGQSRRWLLLPLPPLGLWLGTTGYQCLTNWVNVDPTGMSMGETARCFATLFLASLPLWLAMILMLRRSRPITYLAPMVSGSLAVAAATAAAMNLVHAFDASAMILMWNFGTGALIVLISMAIGRSLLPNTLRRG